MATVAGAEEVMERKLAQADILRKVFQNLYVGVQLFVKKSIKGHCWQLMYGRQLQHRNGKQAAMGSILLEPA